MAEFVVWFCVFYVWHILGTTVGYHRLLAHRTFKCPKLVEYFFVLGGYLAFESSPIWWATVHRAHHRYVDTPLDPHSPRFGDYQAYAGWIFHKRYPEHINPQLQAPDLINDPVYSFLERCNNWHRSHLTNSAIGFGSRLVLWLFFGWKIALASVLAGLVCQQVPFLLNVVCHKRNLGYKNYEEGDDSVNVWWLLIPTMGDNWHNNHHAFPGCARSGFRWFEIDFSYMVIKMLESLRLASNVNSRFTLEDNVSPTGAVPVPLPVPVPVPVQVQAPVTISVMQTLRADESVIR
ncbi:MAG: acyl-CoA desaturase [Cyanobacteria bacterium SZAS LIN-5]|nr:acyl-CoA desaturase [Cyanobacteria bacterium SZAS LIN-5]